MIFLKKIKKLNKKKIEYKKVSFQGYLFTKNKYPLISFKFKG